MSLPLNFSAALELLAALFDIPPERATALRGRIQYFQDKGFPPGTKTGRGKRASYGPREIIMLTVALSLLQQGLTPGRCLDNLIIFYDLIERSVKKYYGRGGTILLAFAVKELEGGPRHETAITISVNLDDQSDMSSDLRVLANRDGAVLVNLTLLLTRLDGLLTEEDRITLRRSFPYHRWLEDDPETGSRGPSDE